MKVSFLALVASLLSTSMAAADTLEVGPGATYATLRDALAAANDGDVIEIAAGTYAGDGGVVDANNLTIRGMGGQAHLDATSMAVTQRKGILVINGEGVVLENLELSGAAVSASDGCNGAGIRLQSIDLTVRNCYFHDNENGILGAPPTAGTGFVVIEDSEFARNGSTNGSSGCQGFSHGAYINRFASLTVRGSYFHESNHGHELKTRARENVILYSRFANQGGSGSRELELTEGGVGIVIGNVFQQTSSGENSQMLAFGLEGAELPNELFVANNTFVNERGSGVFVAVGDGAATGFLVNNLFVGGGTVLTGGLDFTMTTNLETNMPLFVNRGMLDVRLEEASPAVDMGSPVPMGAGMSLTPTMHHVVPVGQSVRTLVGTSIDIGAYEFGDSPPVTDAGAPPADSGMANVDGGAGLDDAGNAPEDTGTGPMPGVDGSSPIEDAGTAEPDAADAEPMADEGCGCRLHQRSRNTPWALLPLAALLAFRRSRTR